MIIGIGTDIVSVARIEKIYKRYQNKFLHKILSFEEIKVIEKSSNKISFLAGRFAAKEALVKACGLGFINGIWFTQISITNDINGAPKTKLSGALQEIIGKLNVNINLSISHESDYAVAFVVLESINNLS